MSTTSVGSATNSVMGKDAFLKMLIAQMKNQDPLNPLNGSDFAAQLAQFSSVEQLINVSSQLESLSTNIAAMANSQMSNLIGCEVDVRGEHCRGGRYGEGPHLLAPRGRDGGDRLYL